MNGWQYLGWPTPTIAEETRPDYVVLTMRVGDVGQEKPTRKTYKMDVQKI